MFFSSAGSETCSCNTSEAASNALLPPSLRLIHCDEDEASTSSAHSYNSSSTATPTSSPTPVLMTHPCPALYLCPTRDTGPPSNMLPAHGAQTAAALHFTGGQYKHAHNAAHPSSLQSAVYPVNPSLDQQKQVNNMVPLARMYSPGSHLYESATLIRPNANIMVPNCSMFHWGNVPSSFAQPGNSHHAMTPGNTPYDSHQFASMIPMHSTMVHPLQYYPAQTLQGGHSCLAQHPQLHIMGMNQYPVPMTSVHHPHIHQCQPPTHLPLPLHSSTLMPSGRSDKTLHDGISCDDLTPTNSMSINSVYNTSPRPENDLVATTCLSTVSVMPGENEYSTTLDSVNLNSHNLIGNFPQEFMQIGAISDTSSSSHPSTASECVMVTESSLDSSGTSSSINPLCVNHKPDLPPLPSRADRYRIYARNNDPVHANRCSSYKRSQYSNLNNNNAVHVVSSDKSNCSDSSSSRSAKGCDNPQNPSPIGRLRDACSLDQHLMDVSNAANNNIANNNVATGNPYECDNMTHNEPLEDFAPPSPPEAFASRTSCSRRSTSTSVAAPSNVLLQRDQPQDEEIYTSCNDT